MKRKNSGNLIVYSTDKTIDLSTPPEEEQELMPSEQKLKLKFETKNRGGKAVTVVDGFTGKGIDSLAKSLKAYCGTGGSVKDGQIIIQGDNRQKIKEWLVKNGYNKTT